MKLHEVNQLALNALKKAKVRQEKPEEIKARHEHARKAIGSNLAKGLITKAQHDKQMKAHLEETLIDDVKQAGWYAVHTENGKVVEGPKVQRTAISAEYRDKEGGEYEIVHITSADLDEGFEDPLFTPQQAAALTKARQSGDPADWDAVDDRELNYKLYRIFLDSGEMPYGTAKGRTGDPYNWIADRLERMSDMEFAGFVRNHTEPSRHFAVGKGIGA